MAHHIHLIGFGSQGTAWAEILRDAGWRVQVYLATTNSRSYARAREAGFCVDPIVELADRIAEASASTHPEESFTPPLVGMLLPDSLIAPVYGDFLASLDSPMTLVLAHGYAVYAGELRAAQLNHELALLAPKAIGPELLNSAKKAKLQGQTHDLVAAFYAPLARRSHVLTLAEALGFSQQNLVETDFETETLGDLISEQGLLCGGLFTMLEHTLREMRKAGIPESLIKEECLTELSLIANLLKNKGIEKTLNSISQNAQAGAIAMRDRLNSLGIEKAFEEQAKTVVNKNFVKYIKQGDWQKKLSSWIQEFLKH